MVENLLAAVSQHQRQKNGEQTKNRMRARALNGFWVYQAPVGFRFERAKGGGKILVHDEPLASVVREVLEGFASRRFCSQAEVKRYLERHPQWSSCRSGYVKIDLVFSLLTNPLYAGYLELPSWEVSFRKAQHEGLISLETFQRNQELLSQRTRMATRSDLNEDFPLRGWVKCIGCGEPLTANWSKGSHKSYPYYLCRQPGCALNGKSIARAKIEEEFEALLRSVTPSAELISLATTILTDLWDKRIERGKLERTSLKREIKSIDDKIAQLLDRVVEAESRTVIAAYEGRIADLEKQKLVLDEKLASCGRPIRGYDATFRTAIDFLSSPWTLWASDKLEDKRAVLKLTFADQLEYDRDEGFRTPNVTLPFKALGHFSDESGEWRTREDSNL